MKHIFLDMDGVIADWDGRVMEIFGEDFRNVPRGKLWATIDRRGADFWANLDPYPWADELWKYCNSVAPTHILTSPSQDPECMAGKYRWMKKQFGNGFRNFFVGPHKWVLAQPGYALIDDRETTIDKFTEAGGVGLLFPRDWNRNKEHQEDPMKWILNHLH